MKTLCLAKKSAALPGKADYANLLTSGLGARKWVASLDFDAESFKAAIVNIYPRLSSVPSYTLWNVKPDKTFEKLPSTVNTPKRIKAYLGSSFTGSLIIMPSEEISLGPVKVPVMTGSGNHKFSSSTASVRSARSSSSSKTEKDNSSGYESMTSYQESNHGGSSREPGSSSSYYTPHQASSNSSSSHKMSHINSQQGSNGRSHRQICLTCGRLAKQAGSTSFYDIHNSTTFSTSDGYVSIAKKLRLLFHLELPRSKLVTSDQICRKCFRALNEIHFLETQLKRSKEEMMSTLFATVAKISKLEQIAREQAASSSSDSSTSSLGTLMTAAALNPWFQEARYVIEQKALTAGIVSGNPEKSSVSPNRTQETSQEGPEHEGEGTPQGPPKQQQQQQAAVAIFQSHKSATGEGRYVDYSSPQPVFLAPLAGFTHSAAVAAGNPGRHRSQSPAVDERSPAAHQAMVPINLVSTRPAVSNDSRRSPLVSSAPAMFLSNSPHYYAQSSIREESRDERRAKKRIEREAIEEQMAAEEEAEAKDLAAERAERDHAAYLEEAYHCRRRLEANEEKAARSQGHCSDSSRSSSMGNNSSPDSQSPSPPTTSSNGGSDSTNISNGECSYESNKKYTSPKHERRSYWKKRYHDHKDDIDEEYGQDKKSPRMSVKSPDKQQRSMVAPSIGNDGTNGTETIKHGLIQSESNTVVDDQERE